MIRQTVITAVLALSRLSAAAYSVPGTLATPHRKPAPAAPATAAAATSSTATSSATTAPAAASSAAAATAATAATTTSKLSSPLP